MRLSVSILIIIILTLILVLDSPLQKIFYFEWSPPWHFKTCLDIYSDILPNILFDIYSDIIFGILFVIYSDSLSEIYSDILCGILSDIYSDMLSVCLGLAVRVRQNTAILRLQLGSDGEHSDPQLAVRVRQGTLRSCDCSWGPVGNTLILSLLFGFGREHCDLALAAEVRQGTLRSSACSWGPARIALILSLLFGSGREPCDLIFSFSMIHFASSSQYALVDVGRPELHDRGALVLCSFSGFSSTCELRGLRQLYARDGESRDRARLEAWRHRDVRRECVTGSSKDRASEWRKTGKPSMYWKQRC